MLAGLGALGLVACAPAPAVPEREARPYPRVMSMNPCIDAILVRVADAGQIVSISHYSHDPAATSLPLAVARRFPANQDSAEEVVLARPDVVLLGPHVAPATQTAIRSVGVRIETVGVPTTIAESLEQVRQVARAVGHPARGDALAAQIEAALARAAPSPGERDIPALVWQGGGLVPGAGTLMDELMSRTGFRNVATDHGLAMWDVLSLELLVMRPPRIVFSDRPQEGTSRLAEVPGLRQVAFPDRLLQCAGPNLVEAARVLAAAREPGA